MLLPLIAGPSGRSCPLRRSRHRGRRAVGRHGHAIITTGGREPADGVVGVRDSDYLAQCPSQGRIALVGLRDASHGRVPVRRVSFPVPPHLRQQPFAVMFAMVPPIVGLGTV